MNKSSMGSIDSNTTSTISEYIKQARLLPDPPNYLLYSTQCVNICICIIGFASNIMILYILYRLYRKEKLEAFYYLSVNIAICDIIKITTLVFIFSSLIYNTSSEEFTGNWSNVFMFHEIALYGTLIFVSFSAVNRFLIFKFPHFNQILFQNRIYFKLLLILSWLFTVVFSAFEVRVVTYSYEPKILNMYVTKRTNVAETTYSIYQIMFKSLAVLSCIILLLNLSTAFLLNQRLKSKTSTGRKSSEAGRTRAELRLVLQGLIIWSLVILSMLSYSLYSGKLLLTDLFGYYFPNVLDSLIDILTSTFHPFVYVICDRRIRKELLLVFGINSKKPLISFVSKS